MRRFLVETGVFTLEHSSHFTMHLRDAPGANHRFWQIVLLTEIIRVDEHTRTNLQLLSEVVSRSRIEPQWDFIPLPPGTSRSSQGT